ncbi:MAG: FCD domain-containing protein [Proteobacteria bacterium]|nr:FCD domain-containing protein [Pseudomonadota bacterium]
MSTSPADHEPGFERIQTTRAFEEVSAQIRRRVIHGQLRAGDRLPSERDLALKLGVSRNTVREALRGLEMAGVLRSMKGTAGGACVVAPDGQLVSTALQDMFQLGSVTPAQLTEARLLITENVVRLACERLDEAALQALEDNVKASRQASDAGDLAARSRINMEFHKLLAAQTGNPVFVAIMNGLIAVMHNFMETLGPPTGNEVYASRKRFIAHLRRRDADAAIAEMARFLRGTHRHYLSKLESRGPR